MGKPRMIILIRHAQSEGNKNRDIHQTIPDHRVKLTPEGRLQAHEAGLKLRSLLRPDDTLHFFTSPYRRTRETTEGILSALTSSTPTPSPFPRHTIKVYEEPRLREQDFGNFQPSSSEMARMWQERADYGHFFYRIPNGESAADAYDRVSGFNDTLWRSFGADDFASVCVLVTHGLMTRVFLMKWYHFSVEYFEDLRNVNHCEFVVMKRSLENGKFILQNQLRTWSELREEKAAKATTPQSPVPVRKKWGGCSDGYERDSWVANIRRQDTAELFLDDDLEKAIQRDAQGRIQRRSQNGDVSGAHVLSRVDDGDGRDEARSLTFKNSSVMTTGRDGGGSMSGATSRSGSSDDENDTTRAGDALSKQEQAQERMDMLPVRENSMAVALHGDLNGIGGRMRLGARADALGDQSDVDDGSDVELERLETIDESFKESVR